MADERAIKHIEFCPIQEYQQGFSDSMGAIP